MRAKKQWIFLAIIIVLSVAVTAYFGTSHSEVARLSITAYPQPAKVGYATIQLNSTIPLKEAHVFLPDRPAVLSSNTSTTWDFRYFVSPYDDVGVKQITAYVTDANGHRIKYDNASLYVGYNAAGTKFNGIIFYSYKWDPALAAFAITHSGHVNMIYVPQQGEESGNQSLQAFVNTIILLTSRGTNVTVYEAGAQDGKWVSCRATNKTLGVGACLNATKEPSIVFHQASYPTTQAYVTNTTIDIMPSPDGVNATVGAIGEALNYRPPRIVVNTNSTANSSA